MRNMVPLSLVSCHVSPPIWTTCSNYLSDFTCSNYLSDFTCSVSFAAVCKGWRNAKRLAEAANSHPQPPPRQIPWLLFPSPSSHGQGPSITSFLSGSRRRIRSLPDDISRSRLCSPHPGGWVTDVLSPWGQQVLFNVLSLARINLPHRMRYLTGKFSSVSPVTIHSVVLSAAPNAEDCFAGAIVSGASNIAFCRPGVDRHWNACFPEYERLQDMVYIDIKVMGGFHVLTEEGHVVVFKLEYIEGRSTFVPRTRYNMIMPLRPDTMLPFLPSSTSVTRYLVTSRQSLLMVARYFVQLSGGMCRTLLFRIFDMRVMVPQAPQGLIRAYWLELDGLDGRVLFVGRGCSRAYEVSQLHGFEEGSIYFTDDAKVDLAFASEYPCSDTGMYSMSTVVRPGLDSPPYGTKTYLCWTEAKDKTTNETKKSLIEMKEDYVQRSGSKIMGIHWNFPAEPVSKFSPPIWLAP